MKLKNIVLGTLAAACMSTGAFAQDKCLETPAKEHSEIVNAMEAELNRTFGNLKIDGYEEPFYMSYNTILVDRWIGWGYYGSSESERNEIKLARAEVRIGSHDDETFSYKMNSLLDTNMIRRALWIAGDEALKSAEKSHYMQKAMKINQAKPKEKAIKEFSVETPNVCYVEEKSMEIDSKGLEDMLRNASKEFSKHNELSNSRISMEATKTTNIFMNTEGTRISSSKTIYKAAMLAEIMTEEGEAIKSYRIYNVRKVEELPVEAELKDAVREMAEELVALKNAPKLGPVSVPAILDSDNTGVFWHEVIGHRLEGERQRNKNEGGTFTGKVGQKVTSDIVTLIDDPTLESFKGRSLNGHYLFDEEGVRAQRVVLIEKGVLKNYMMSRTPIDGFEKSNGHGRSNLTNDPVARMSNTILSPEKSYSIEELRKMATEEARKQGKDFYLVLKGSRGGLTATDASSDFQAFKTMPVLTYKVDIKTGKETLVRPVELIGTPLSMLEEIMAFGNDNSAWNGFCGAESGFIPASVIAPSMLVKKLEVQNMSKNMWEQIFGGQATPPILPPPEDEQQKK